MTIKTKPDLPFFNEKEYSLKAISQTWLNMRCGELGGDLQGAFQEVLDGLVDRLGNNVEQEGECRIYFPDNETDPYVFAIPLDRRSEFLRSKAKAQARVQHLMPLQTVEQVAENKTTTVKEDFENLLFEENDGYDHRLLNTDEQGNYTDPKTRNRWEGFLMYHQNFTILGKDHYKNKYGKTLGKYVVARLAKNGIAIFTAAPYRHQTKADAVEKANALSKEFMAPFSVFRCMDIYDVGVE